MIAEVNGTEIFYKIRGEGEPLLMMHGGLGQDHTVFSPWLEPLEERFKVIYYDHRGNGRSGRPPLETLTHENFAKDADELRRFLGIDEMILFGHSYGSFLALEYAVRYQEHLTHLVWTPPGTGSWWRSGYTASSPTRRSTTGSARPSKGFTLRTRSGRMT